MLVHRTGGPKNVFAVFYGIQVFRVDYLPEPVDKLGLITKCNEVIIDELWCFVQSYNSPAQTGYMLELGRHLSSSEGS